MPLTAPRVSFIKEEHKPRGSGHASDALAARGQIASDRAGQPMGMSNGPWPPDDDRVTDPDVEWAFFGPHDVEYWVVRDGQLVPAEDSELERILERERERAAQGRLLRWEREQRHARRPGVVLRFVSWCRRLFRRAPAGVHRAEPTTTEGHADQATRRRSDIAHWRT